MLLGQEPDEVLSIEVHCQRAEAVALLHLNALLHFNALLNFDARVQLSKPPKLFCLLPCTPCGSLVFRNALPVGRSSRFILHFNALLNFNALLHFDA